jgi:peptide/nickel transport system permease protein
MTVHTFIDEQPETGPAITPLKTAGGRTTDTGSAGQWQLMWQKFSRNKLALFSGCVIIFFLFIGIFAEFLAPSVPDASRAQFTNAPPQQLGFFVTEEDGSTRFQLHVTGYAMEVDPASLRRTYVPDPEQHVPVGLFVRGAPYKMWGLFNADIHFLGPLNPNDTMYLLGTDRLGRDLMTRLVYGTRISMSIGVVGVCISLLLGVVLGAVSGFYGGIIDTLTQRLIEVISSMPTIPLWLGLAAAIPLTWSPLTVYFVITLIVSLFGWTGLAREVRGRFFDHPGCRDPGIAHNDRCRDGAELPRHRPKGPDRLLGRTAAGGPECPHHRQCTMAAHMACRRCGGDGACLQLPWRRHARRR